MFTSTYTGEGMANGYGVGGGNYGFIIFILFILWIFFGMGKEGYCNQDMRNDNTRNTAEIEYRNLEEQRNAKEAIMGQASAIRNEQLASEMFDLKLSAQTKELQNGQLLIAKDGEIQRLHLAMADQERYCALNQKIDSIACRMLKSPEIFGTGYVTTGTPIPAPIGGCGFPV